MAIQILSGMRLTPERLNALAPVSGRRTTDLTVTNSTTLVDALSVPVVAGAEYDVEALLIYEAPTGQDVKAGFNWPSGTMVWGLIGLDPAATTITGDLRPVAYGSPSNDQTFPIAGAGAGNQLTALLRGTLVTSLSSGNLRLRWAQSTAAAATSAVLKAGSSLQVRRIA